MDPSPIFAQTIAFVFKCKKFQEEVEDDHRQPVRVLMELDLSDNNISATGHKPKLPQFTGPFQEQFSLGWNRNAWPEDIGAVWLFSPLAWYVVIVAEGRGVTTAPKFGAENCQVLLVFRDEHFFWATVQ